MLQIDFQYIKTAVKKSTLTQMELAKMVGLKQPTLSKKLRGQPSVDLVLILKVSAILDIPVVKVMPGLQKSIRDLPDNWDDENQKVLSTLLKMLSNKEIDDEDYCTQAALRQS